jgi:LPS-assembly protein
MKLVKNSLLGIFGSVLVSSVSAAELGDEYSTLLCPQSLNIPDRPYVEAELAEGDTFMTADEADLVEGGISTLTGKAEITRDIQQVTADVIKYNEPNDTADLKGDINYWDDAVFLNSKEAFLQFDNGIGEFTNADYILKESRGRGSADKLVLDIGTKTDMEKVEYTTCDPDDQFWKMSASSLSLDHENNKGTAKNVVIKIKNFPVFYTPYLSFPLSKERKSGFLAPGYGSTKRYGVELRTPYYWNISPNMDATFTPRLFSDTGMMGIGEYRYMFSRGSGEVNLEYLPNDNNRNDDDRSLFGFKHQQTFANSGKLFVDYNQVSDKFYFEDFGSQLSSTSTRFLEQRADVSYRGKNWNLFTRVQNYQVVDRSIDGASRPYKRLPQVLFNYNSTRVNRAINYGLNSEAVYFDRGESTSIASNVNGLRVDLNPYLSFPVSTRATFIEPKVRLRYTQYSLSDKGNFESSPSRVLPVVSLDSGVFFERDVSLFNKNFMQTLEPRLYYLYVPETDQSDLPVFDTGLYTFSFNSLFREDRFNNPDRMGDANQVTLAVTSNLVNQNTGINVGSVSVGQIFYLDKRKVALPNNTAPEDDFSAFVGAFNTTAIKHWNISGDIQWNPNVSSSTEKLTAQATYNPAPGKILNLAYRINRQRNKDIEQSDLSVRWPLVNNWNVVGRWNYAIPEGRSLEAFAGLEYESCCWGARAVARRYLTDIDGDFETGIFLQLELKGLAGVGKKTVDFLKQQIPGYQSEF